MYKFVFGSWACVPTIERQLCWHISALDIAVEILLCVMWSFVLMSCSGWWLCQFGLCFHWLLLFAVSLHECAICFHCFNCFLAELVHSIFISVLFCMCSLYSFIWSFSRLLWVFLFLDLYASFTQSLLAFFFNVVYFLIFSHSFNWPVKNRSQEIILTTLV